MRIVELQAENFKRIKSVDIKPQGDAVIIAGQNDQGKSSCLDAIMAALGKATGKDIPEPIRRGENHAEVMLDLGDIRVRRVWDRGKAARVELTTDDGKKFSSPQAILDGLVGKLAFDPLEFARMAPRDQRATLLKLVELPFDIDEHDRARQELLAAKTEVTRRIKQLNDVTPQSIPFDTPDEEIASAEIMQQLDALRKQRALNDRKRDELRIEERNLEICGETVNDLERKVEEAEAKLKTARAELALSESTMQQRKNIYTSHQAEVAALVDPDTSEMEAKLASLDEINRNVRAKQANRKHAADIGKAQSDFIDADVLLDAHDEQKMTALKEAKFPVEGLSFSEDGVLFNDLPFAQASESQRIMVSSAMGMAMNPKLRVLFIRDGSLLDDSRLEMITQLATEKDYQIWVERIQPGAMPCIEIVDGAVAEAV